MTNQNTVIHVHNVRLIRCCPTGENLHLCALSRHSTCKLNNIHIHATSIAGPWLGQRRRVHTEHRDAVRRVRDSHEPPLSCAAPIFPRQRSVTNCGQIGAVGPIVLRTEHDMMRSWRILPTHLQQSAISSVGTTTPQRRSFPRARKTAPLSPMTPWSAPVTTS